MVIKNTVTKILVAIDGTKKSNKLVKMAINMARQSEATITGMYVQSTQSHSTFANIGTGRESIGDDVREVLNNAKRLAAQNGITFKEKIVHGDAGYNIIKVANSKKYNFNMLIIGTRGRSAIKGLFLGSISNYVVQSSRIPVLIIK